MHACPCKFRNCQAVYVSMTSDDVIVLYSWAKGKCTITNSKLFGFVIYKLALKLDKNTK